MALFFQKYLGRIPTARAENGKILLCAGWFIFVLACYYIKLFQGIWYVISREGHRFPKLVSIAESIFGGWFK